MNDVHKLLMIQGKAKTAMPEKRGKTAVCIQVEVTDPTKPKSGKVERGGLKEK